MYLGPRKNDKLAKRVQLCNWTIWSMELIWNFARTHLYLTTCHIVYRYIYLVFARTHVSCPNELGDRKSDTPHWTHFSFWRRKQNSWAASDSRWAIWSFHRKCGGLSSPLTSDHSSTMSPILSQVRKWLRHIQGKHTRELTGIRGKVVSLQGTRNRSLSKTRPKNNMLHGCIALMLWTPKI